MTEVEIILVEAARLHLRAMELAGQAEWIALQSGRCGARDHFRDAFQAGRLAAECVMDPGIPEPSRSIILRSVACLAIDAGEFGEARHLADAGLAGSPPEYVARELREISALL